MSIEDFFSRDNILETCFSKTRLYTLKTRFCFCVTKLGVFFLQVWHSGYWLMVSSKAQLLIKKKQRAHFACKLKQTAGAKGQTPSASSAQPTALVDLDANIQEPYWCYCMHGDGSLAVGGIHRNRTCMPWLYERVYQKTEIKQGVGGDTNNGLSEKEDEWLIPTSKI